MLARDIMPRDRETTPPVLEIRPRRPWEWPRLAELWEYRELFLFLAWREVQVRYRQTLIGTAWAILQPLLGMVVFSLFFGRLAKVPSDGVPYPLFSYVGLLAWTFFAGAVSGAAASLVGAGNLIQKVYFPRVVVPASAVLAATVDLGPSLFAAGGLMWWFGASPRVEMFAALGFFAIAVVAALGVGMGLAALNVEYRDVRYALPFALQLWMFSTPIVYPGSLVPERWRALYSLNPMASVVDGVRWALLGTPPPPASAVAAGALAAIVMFAVGLAYFHRVERTFADVI